MKSSLVFPTNQYTLPRGLIKKCQLCSQQFGVFLRQHLCKRCNRTICSNCGSQKKELFKIGYQKRGHRVCKICKGSSEHIIKYIKIKNLSFNSMSMVAINWLSKMKKPHLVQNNKYMSNVLNVDHVKSLWDSYSFQFREFVGLLTFQYQHKSIFQVVNNVINKVLAVDPTLKTVQIIYLIIFFLCFASIDNAVMLTLGFIQLKNKVMNEKDTIFRCLREFPFQGDLPQLQRYINYRIDKHYNTFMVNATSMECLIATVNKVFETGNYEEVIYCFTSHLFTSRKWLMVNSNNYNFCDIQMLRNANKQEIWTNFQYLRKKKLIFEKEEQLRTKSQLVMPENLKNFNIEERLSEGVEQDHIQISMKKRQLSNNSGSINEESFSQIGSMSIKSHQEIPNNIEEEELRRTVSQLRSEIQIRNKEVNQLKSEKSIHSDGFALLKKVATLEANLKTAQLRNDKDKLQILKLKQTIKQHEDIPKDLIKQNQQLKQTKSNNQQQLNKLKTQLEVQAYKFTNLEKQSKNLQIIANQHEMLLDQNKKFKQIIEQLQSQIKSLKSQLETSGQKILSFEKEATELRGKLGTMQLAKRGDQTDLQIKIQQAINLQEDIKRLKAKCQQLNEANHLKDTAIKQLQNELQSIRSTNVELQEKIVNYQKEQSEIRDSNQYHLSMQKIQAQENSSLKEKINEIQEKYEQMQKTANLKNAAIEQLQFKLQQTKRKLQQVSIQIRNNHKEKNELLNKRLQFSIYSQYSQNLILSNPLKSSLSNQSTYSQNFTMVNPLKGKMKMQSVYSQQHRQQSPKKDKLSSESQAYRETVQPTPQQPISVEKDNNVEINLIEILKQKDDMIAHLKEQLNHLSYILGNTLPHSHSLPTTQLKQRITEIQDHNVKLTKEIDSLNQKNTQFVSKIGQISSLAIKFEEEKMNLAEEVFELKDILKQHNISLED